MGVDRLLPHCQRTQGRRIVSEQLPTPLLPGGTNGQYDSSPIPACLLLTYARACHANKAQPRSIVSSQKGIATAGPYAGPYMYCTEALRVVVLSKMRASQNDTYTRLGTKSHVLAMNVACLLQPFERNGIKPYMKAYAPGHMSICITYQGQNNEVLGGISSQNCYHFQSEAFGH